jgi:Ca-activated chloride channel family protein
MRSTKKLLAVFICMASMLKTAVVGAEIQRDDDDKTLSPYFLVTTDDAELDQFALKSTSAEVDIAGVIADVKVTQVYANDGSVPLEAIYIFPASTRAAVYGMKMTIGERIIVAKIEKREAARQQYEEARREGKSASLLEQQRPNVFQMNVANILPGDEITVELKYTELLVPTAGVYELVYPTVVGPRFSDQPEAGAPPTESWVKNPYLHEGEPVPYAFDIEVDLSTGLPLQEVTCPSHKVNVSYDGPSFGTIKLDPSENLGGNRDFILRYRLEGGQIESGLLLYEGEEENFFLLMMQPPERVTVDQIPPREYIFIVDVSGSMHGFPLEISKKLLRDLIGNLRPNDLFNVLLFAGGSNLMSEKSLPATTKNINMAISVIDGEKGGGGTRLLPALQRALALPRSEGFSRTIVIATDGYVSVEEKAFDLIRKNLNDANMFTFGIGTGVNRYLLEGMARVGMGEPMIITEPDQAPAGAKRFRTMIQTPVLTRIKVDYGSFEAYDVEPPSIPDLLAERPLIVFGKWKGRPRGDIKLEGLTGERTFKKKVDVADVKSLESNSALRYLWARQRIAVLSDYNSIRGDEKRIEEVTDLGLTYNLLTAYTSFVAVDTEVRLKDGKVTTVKQPLPLPQGVSDLAVGQPGLGVHMKRSMSGAAVRTQPQMARTITPFERAEEESGIGLPTIRLGKISVTGDLTTDAVDKVFSRERKTIEQCYLDALKSQPGLKGKIVLELEIDLSGNVSKASLMSSEPRSKDLEQCIIEEIKKWSFLASATVEITLVLIL